MPTTAEQIDLMLEEQNLNVFKKCEDDDCWMIPFDSYHVLITLKEEGEYLWFRGSILADLDELPVKERLRALEHFMELNDRIKLGRFCGYPQIAFEVSLPIEDGELTAAQFERCLSTTTRATSEERYVPKAAGGLEPFFLTGSSRIRSTGTSPECN